MEKITELDSIDERPDYDRLKTLFSISQKLSVFKNVKDSFSDIITSAADGFPLLSAVLIEHWERVPHTVVWFSPGASKRTVASALLNAKTNYSYFTGYTVEEAKDFLKDFSDENELSRCENSRSSNESIVGNYIILPLMIDNLSPHGALQLEGSKLLTLKDLEFVATLSNLVSVALDRYYKTKRERDFIQAETRVNLEAISLTRNKVQELEVERSLREDFVSLLTHDLKSPIAVIMGAGEIICKRSDSPETVLKLGQMIVGQSHHVTRMINNLLDANKIRSGQLLALKLETTNLNALVDSTIAALKLVHGDRFQIECHHPIVISCDGSGVRRILENLCNNAVKYGSKETPITVELAEGNSDVFIRVHNFGKVISDDDQRNIFQQFQRSRDAERGHNEGWGIGLTLVRGVAEAHGGSVAVESTTNAGTSFIVKLPKHATLIN
jgi:signal transduction histidine kinase